MQSVYQVPHPALAPYVRCYWEVRCAVEPRATRQLSFGCTGRMHWLIFLENMFQTTVDDGQPLTNYGSMLVGQMIRPFTHQLTTTVRAITIDFTPTGFHRLRGLPADELANQTAEAKLIFGNDVATVVDQVRREPQRAARFARLDAFFLRRLQHSLPTDGRIEAAVDLLHQAISRVNHPCCTDLTIGLCWTLCANPDALSQRHGMADFSNTWLLLDGKFVTTKPYWMHTVPSSALSVDFSPKNTSIPMKRILLFCLISLTALFCKKEADVTPMDSCKLAQFVDGDRTNDLTYDAAGNLTQWVATSDLKGGSKFAITYAFTRDATGRISTRVQTIAIDGKDQGKPSPTQYTYTNGLLTSARTVYDLVTSSRVVSQTYTYDSNQRIIKVVSTETGLTQTSTYEYDSRGNCIRYVSTATDGFKDERVLTYDTSKNPEQLLTKSIPFNFSTGLPWSVNVALTTKSTFDDGTGPVTSTSKRTNLKTDARGYVIGSTKTYDDGYVAEETYTLTNCN